MATNVTLTSDVKDASDRLLRARAMNTGRTVEQVKTDDHTLQVHLDHLEYGNGDPCPCSDCRWERRMAKAAA